MKGFLLLLGIFWTSKEWHLFTAQSQELWNGMQLYFLWYSEYKRM